MPNTTATTTSQIIVPGLEASIASILTPIIVGQTNTALASLTTSINSNIAALGPKFASPIYSRDNSEPSAFPTFAIWTNQNNEARAGFTIWDSENQKIGDQIMKNYQNTYTSVSLDNMNNWYEDFRGYTYTNGNIGASTVTNYFGGSTVWGSADGHQLYHPQLWNNYSPTQFNRADQRGQFLIRCGSIIGAEGVRQRYSHYTTDSEFQIRPRGSTYGYIDRVDMNSVTYATWAGRTNRGMSSYNDRTKTLAVVESNTSNQIRLHIWKNTARTLNGWAHRAGELHNFMSEAKTAGPSGVNSNYAFYDFTWSQTGSTRNEPSYHMKLTMGDNGIVGFTRFNHDGYAQYYGYFTPASSGSAGNSGTGTFTDSGVNLGNTTSYGIDQSESWYGMKHQISWDNAWMATYSPYYYYACGINCHLINTYDPTKIFHFRNTSTTNGCAIVPYGKSKFITIDSQQNADGQGSVMYIVDPSSAALNFRRQNNTTLSYGGDLQPYNIAFNYQYDQHSNTTSYPHLVSMPHWTNP